MWLGVAAAPAAADTSEELLRNRPFAPTDRGVFSNFYYPETPADVPAEGTAWTEEQGRAALADYLGDEFPGDSGAQNAALAVYDSAVAEQKIPDAQLRAALAALKGTFADAAVDYFLNAQTSLGNPLFSVRYGGVPGDIAAIVNDGTTSDPDDRVIVFQRSYQYENPFLLTSIWLHEPLHEDGSNGAFEEGVNTSLDHLFYLGQLVRHPELAATGTKLSSSRNTSALARLNSGSGSRLGLFETNGGGQLFPGSSSVPDTSWWEWERQRNHPATPFGGATPGNTLLGQLLANTHEPGATACSGAEFSQALLDCIDANGNSGLCASELSAAAQALKLNLGGNPTDAGTCAGAGADSCDDAKAKLKKAKEKLKKAKKSLRRAKQSGDEGKIAKAKKKVKRAKKKVKKAKKTVKDACG